MDRGWEEESFQSDIPQSASRSWGKGALYCEGSPLRFDLRTGQVLLSLSKAFRSQEQTAKPTTERYEVISVALYQGSLWIFFPSQSCEFRRRTVVSVLGNLLSETASYSASKSPVSKRIGPSNFARGTFWGTGHVQAEHNSCIKSVNAIPPERTTNAK